MNDQEFIENVKRDLTEYDAHAVTSNGDKFAVWFANKFLGLDVGEVIDKFHIGASGDEKTDIGIVDDRFPTKIIIQCKYSENPLSKTFGKNEVDEVLQARNRIDTAPNDGNDRRRQFVQDFKASKLPEKLIVVGFGKFTNQPNNNAYEYALKNNVQIYDFDRLKREYLRILDPAAAERPPAVELPISPDKFFEFKEGNVKAYFMSVPTKNIFELVRDTGDGIFEENLRYQLPKANVSSLISGEIKGTLEKEPMEFIILNNGITFICEKGEKQNGTLKLINPQIINGCQTSYAIFEQYDNWQKSGKDIGTLHSYIPVKVIETDINDTKRIGKISRAANLQNPITARNRYSNDDLQKSLRAKFGNLPKKIFFDCKDGQWESLTRQSKQSSFKVPKIRGKVFRILNNQLVGQIYLSLMGKPHFAGNQKGIVFSDEKTYSAIFNYELPSAQRFPGIGISEENAMLKSSEKDFIDDTMFGFRVYKFLEAMEFVLYPKKKEQYEDDITDPNYNYYTKITTKEFVTYWHFHAIRLLHEIIYTKASGDPIRVAQIRTDLVSDEVDLFFSPVKVIAEKFNVEKNPKKYTILDIENPSNEFPLFGKWISNLEQIVYDVVSPEKEKPDWKGFNQFFYKRETTLNDIRNKVTDILGGADSDIKFPLKKPNEIVQTPIGQRTLV